VLTDVQSLLPPADFVHVVTVCVSVTLPLTLTLCESVILLSVHALPARDFVHTFRPCERL
jgi:hypothetical protein